MTMEDAIRSTVAQAMERFAAYVGTPPPAATWSSSSSSATLTNCDINRIHAKAQWLIRMLPWVRATLDDAEDMDVTEESVCDWLRELQAVADAAEDVLDELPHEAWRLELVENGGRTAGSITEDAVDETVHAAVAELLPRLGGERTWETSLPHQVHSSSSATPLHELSVFLCCVEQRMEDIVSRFMNIKKPEQALKLDYRKEQMNAESISARRATSSVIEEPRIVGRDKDLAKIKKFLLSSDAEETRGSDDMDDHVPVMAIVGMGGLGKSTLAQLAYNDDQVNQHFQLKSWVCVSEDFDVIRLTKAMLQSLNVDATGLSQLDPLHQKLVQKLSGVERFLLVLDDVWEADNLNIHSWNLLTAPFRNRTADTKIIMTTRSRIVSEMVPRILTHDLGFLSDEDALELFMLYAFEGRDPNLYQNLVAIGKAIVRRCKGLPLAAKALGGLLLTKGDDEWNEILESEVWNATINQEDSIIPILRLSYRHLPAPLKRCFRYCSLFPKDSVFDRNQIIHMWMAHGYIRPNRRELIEGIGQRYIDNLLLRSFFQKYPNDPKRLQMHDLMHDLARCASGDECYSMEGGNSCPISSDIRHLSIIPTSNSRRIIISSMINITEPNFSRSFLLLDRGFYLSSDSYTRMEHLRVLHLRVSGFSYLLESIASLKHLRYLRISSSFKELPTFVGSLYHLETLDLEPLSKLPNSMTNLINLRHLILSRGRYHLRTLDLPGESRWPNNYFQYPVGIGKLVDLQTMPGFLLSPKHSHAKLGELKDMNSIRGEFTIKRLENLADANEAKNACLDKKRNITSLNLEWGLLAASSPIDDEVLESLKPSVKLRSLKISGFKGPSYPSWLGDGSFSRLSTIKLEHCEKLISLPPLGQLPSLKSLCISEARAVEYIAREFFSGGFPQLEELTLREMDNWNSWCGAQEGECPKLKKLSIDKCPNLESLSLINLGAVEDLSISVCPKLRCMPGHSLELSHLQCPQTIKIQDIYQVWCIEAAHLSTAAPVEDQPPCLQLEDVGRREAVYILGLWYHICQVTVTRCSNLTSLPSSFSFSIRRLTITECANLTSLPWEDLINLEYLTINDCPLFRLLDAEQLPPTLQVSCIYGNPYESHQCSNREGGERNLYLVFCNVHDANEALKFCFRNFTEIHTLDIEWDCCTNDWSNVTDAVMEEVLFYLHSLCISSKRLVIQGYRGSAFAGYYEGFFPMVPRIGLLRSRLSYVSLLQCPACDLGPLSGLPFLQELHVKGASNLKSVVLDCLFPYDHHMSKRERRATHTRIAFPRLQKLEFHDMPAWKEWLETKEGDFPCLWKVVLKHCPRLRELPHLPPGLKELILEGCEELQSLSSSSQDLRSLTSLWNLSVTNCPNLDFTVTEGPPPRLERISLTGCPWLLAWFEGHPRMLECIPDILVDGVRVFPRRRKVSI